MLQTLASPLEQTIIFSILFGFIFILFIPKREGDNGFSLQVTSELKGFAILTIVLGHIGYFLFTDHRFLFPFSAIAGVGVDIFFLLSGYGLAASVVKKSTTPFEFYRRRIGKIFVPLWLSLVLFLALDVLLLHTFYDWQVIVKSFLGFYPTADIYSDLNSPLWYLTPLLFYYLIFPWIFKPRHHFLSAVIFAIISYGMVFWIFPRSQDVFRLYELHYLAFPFGVGMAGLSPVLAKNFPKIAEKYRLNPFPQWFRYLLFLFLGGIFYYSFMYSGVGGPPWIAQIMSLISAITVALFFISKKIRFHLLEIFGNYSYEIYLLHWPILYRHDFFYNFLPAGLATALYLAVFLGLGYLFQRVGQKRPLARRMLSRL